MLPGLRLLGDDRRAHNIIANNTERRARKLRDQVRFKYVRGAIIKADGYPLAGTTRQRSVEPYAVRT